MALSLSFRDQQRELFKTFDLAGSGPGWDDRTQLKKTYSGRKMLLYYNQYRLWSVYVECEEGHRWFGLPNADIDIEVPFTGPRITIDSWWLGGGGDHPDFSDKAMAIKAGNRLDLSMGPIYGKPSKDDRFILKNIISRFFG